MVCTFFGHRDAPACVEEKTEKEIIYLIENKNVDLFYVGKEGNFDFIVRKILKRMKVKYPHIKYYVVLAYMPIKNNEFEDYSDTIYPDFYGNTPHKYRMNKRNCWMVDRTDFVITYVKNNCGGAAKFKEYAERKGKEVYNIEDD